jgi:hypothetical protein
VNDIKPPFTTRKEAVAHIHRLRREALNAKRAYGQPRNPFKAVPGMEAEFQEAARAVHYYDFVLNEIEKSPERKRKLADFAVYVADRYIDYLIGAGLISIAAAGVAVLSAAIGTKVSFLLAGLAAVAVGAELWKRRRPRK